MKEETKEHEHEWLSLCCGAEEFEYIEDMCAKCLEVADLGL